MVTGWGEYEYIRYVENGRSRVMQRTAENCRELQRDQKCRYECESVWTGDKIRRWGKGMRG